MVGEEVLAGSTAPILTMFSSAIGYGEVRPGYSVGDTKIKESGGRGGLMTRMLLQATTTMGWSIVAVEGVKANKLFYCIIVEYYRVQGTWFREVHVVDGLDRPWIPP